MTFAPIDNQPLPMPSRKEPLPDTWRSRLPSPPPTKRPTIWDKDHISETLAGIGAGFLSGQNFSDGMAAASKSMTGQMKQLREDERPDVTYGGPNNQFQITTDRRNGNRTVLEVPEFAKAAKDAAALKNAPDPRTIADIRGRVLTGILTQVPPEGQAEAYRNLMASPERYGVDTRGMPAEWDPTYAAIAGQMGMNVSQTRAADRGDKGTKSLVDHRKAQDAQGAQRVEQGNARVAQGNARVAQGAERLRKAPPSARRGYSAPTTKAQFDALPSGAKFMAPDGSMRIKP